MRTRTPRNDDERLVDGSAQERPGKSELATRLSTRDLKEALGKDWKRRAESHSDAQISLHVRGNAFRSEQHQQEAVDEFHHASSFFRPESNIAMNEIAAMIDRSPDYQSSKALMDRMLALTAERQTARGRDNKRRIDLEGNAFARVHRLRAEREEFPNLTDKELDASRRPDVETQERWQVVPLLRDQMSLELNSSEKILESWRDWAAKVPTVVSEKERLAVDDYNEAFLDAYRCRIRMEDVLGHGDFEQKNGDTSREPDVGRLVEQYVSWTKGLRELPNTSPVSAFIGARTQQEQDSKTPVEAREKDFLELHFCSQNAPTVAEREYLVTEASARACALKLGGRDDA